jgi:putative restriction endonuclease
MVTYFFWEGEEKHGSDNRIISRRDDIHVFYRDRHHSDFTYEGKAVLQHFHVYSDRPSRFVFQLVETYNLVFTNSGRSPTELWH